MIDLISYIKINVNINFFLILRNSFVDFFMDMRILKIKSNPQRWRNHSFIVALPTYGNAVSHERVI